MKNKLFIIVLIACALGATSCASKKAANQQVQQPYPNYIGVQQQPQLPQPPVVPTTDEEGFTVQEMSPIQKAAQNPPYGEIRGYGIGVSPKEQLALNIARSQAVANLQQQIETYIKYAIEDYNDQKVVNESMHIDQSVRENLIALAKGAVVGATVLDSRKLYNSKTKQYKYEVCVKYDRAGVIGAIEEQGQRILQNRAKFIEDMQETWDEYDRLKGNKTKAEYENEMEQENLDRQNERDIAKIEAQQTQQANSNQAIYYYAIGNNQFGPVSIQQLSSLANSGQITINTYIWREGLANWMPAGSLPELKNIFSTYNPGSVPPPVPTY